MDSPQATTSLLVVFYLLVSFEQELYFFEELKTGGLDCTASPPPNAYTLCQIKSQNSITSGTEYPFKKNVVWSWSTFKETLHEKLQKPVCFVERIFQFYATTVFKVGH
jgi:hypothetical protein